MINWATNLNLELAGQLYKQQAMKLITMAACLVASVEAVFRSCRLQAAARAPPPASVFRSSGLRAAVPSADAETPPSPDTGTPPGAGSGAGRTHVLPVLGDARAPPTAST